MLPLPPGTGRACSALISSALRAVELGGRGVDSVGSTAGTLAPMVHSKSKIFTQLSLKFVSVVGTTVLIGGVILAVINMLILVRNEGKEGTAL